MHELSLCEGIMRIVERHAQKESFERVVRVHLQLGDQSCVSEEALTFCFPHVAKGTIAEGAALEFSRVDGAEMRVVELEVG